MRRRTFLQLLGLAGSATTVPAAAATSLELPTRTRDLLFPDDVFRSLAPIPLPTVIRSIAIHDREGHRLVEIIPVWGGSTWSGAAPVTRTGIAHHAWVGYYWRGGYSSVSFPVRDSGSSGIVLVSRSLTVGMDLRLFDFRLSA